MKLRDIFSFSPDCIKTTPVPEGEIRHVRYGEQPWDNYVHRWTTNGHPMHYEMSPNGFGGYSVDRVMKTGVFSANTARIYENLSEQQAYTVLVDREVQTLIDYGGYNQKLTTEDLRKHIADKRYPGNHIFTRMKKNPQALDLWIAARVERHQKRQAAAAQSRPKTPS